MGFSEWIYALWIAGLALQPLLVAVLAFKKVWRKFPLFTAYSVCSLLEDGVGYLVSHNRALYTYVYLVNETIAVILALAVIYEIFTQLFSSHHALRKLAWLTFRLVCVLLVSLGVVVIYTHAPIGEKGMVAAILVVEEASRIVEVGLIMFLFLFSSAFGLQWRQQIFGIVLGLGVFGAVKLAAVTIGSHSYATVGAFNTAVMFSYDLSLLIWIGYLLAPERVTSTAEMPKRAQLEQWNHAIMELINQ